MEDQLSSKNLLWLYMRLKDGKVMGGTIKWRKYYVRTKQKVELKSYEH